MLPRYSFVQGHFLRAKVHMNGVYMYFNQVSLCIRDDFWQMIGHENEPAVSNEVPREEAESLAPELPSVASCLQRTETLPFFLVPTHDSN